jgi:hypothetical protein
MSPELFNPATLIRAKSTRSETGMKIIRFRFNFTLGPFSPATESGIKMRKDFRWFVGAVLS